MNLETIEKLLQIMEQHGLSELEVREGDLEFRAHRGERSGPYVYQSAHPILHAAAQAGQGNAQAAAGPPKTLEQICTPLVGTFYRRPAPNKPPYKELDDHVAKDDVVCIVEAMKVMNEIRADVSGIIRKILVEDSTPVEYGQPLFLVEPD
jgi:acetyl-CoA carboxylase biotin carboxyl carrier protein